MDSDNASTSLLRLPWIKVLWLDGCQGEVSILEALDRSAEIRAVIGDIAQQSGPILRLLDAIIRRAFGDPCLDRYGLVELWLSIWRQGEFDMDVIASYLNAHAAAFDLFGTHPFYQVPNLEYQGDKVCDPVASLMADVPSKPEKFLFSLRGKAAPSCISLAEAARWLVFSQAYDPAGIKTPVIGNSRAKSGKAYAPKGIPGTGYLGNLGLIYLEGRNLFETLMWNFVLFDDARADTILFGKQNDLPPWELPTPDSDSSECSAPTGLVQLETMQSRRMRLVPSEDGRSVVGIISCYGDLLHPVDAMNYETMTAVKQSEPQRKRLRLATAPFMPRIHDTSRAMWRGLSGVLAVSDSVSDGLDDRPSVIRWLNVIAEELAGSGEEFNDALPKIVTIHAQGIEYGTQSSVYVDSYDDRLEIGSALVVHDDEAVNCAIDLAGRVDAAVYEVAKLVQAAEEVKGDKTAKETANIKKRDVEARAYSELDQVFREYLAGLTVEVDPYEHTEVYADTMCKQIVRIGSEAVFATGVQVFATHSDGNISSAKNRFLRNINRLLHMTEDSC